MGRIRLTGATSGYTELRAASTAGNNTITLPTTNGGEVVVSDSSGNVNIDSGTLYIDAANNRVGVGTTSPTAPLDVAEVSGSAVRLRRITSGNNVDINFYNPIGTLGDVARIRMDGDGVSNTVGALSFWTTQTPNSLVERARIDSSGRLLVGTSSESGNSLLTVRGNTGSATGAGVLDIGLGTTRPGSAGTPIGYIRFTSTSNTSSNYHYASIAVESDGTSSSDTDIPGRLVFSTTADGASSPTERMRIRNDGQIWCYSSASGIFSGVSAGAGTTTATFIGQHSATGVNNGTNSFIVWSNGNVVNTNNSYGAISDLKLKENIVDSNSQWDDVKALQVRNYNFKEGQTHTQIGLVAQEVELVSPGLVYETPDRDAEGNELGTTTKSVNYSVLYMKAIKALQEAMERIEQLEATNADLLARVAALESA
jgi:hypothetical protein